MYVAKILNGYNMARMDRYDVEHNPDDDRIVVYVRTDSGHFVRVFIEADGSASCENVDGTTFDAQPLDGEENTQEVCIESQESSAT